MTPDTNPDAGQQKKTYTYDPHLDPQLVWAGKVQMLSIDPPYGIECASCSPSIHESEKSYLRAYDA